MVFLDRDGVINELVEGDSPKTPSDVVLCQGARDAIQQIATAGYLLAVVTNQPAAAKGACTLADLDAVHDRIVELLGTEARHICSWQRCVHHPAGIVLELSTRCTCRKPASGMLLRAARECGYPNIPAGSVIIGDSDVDMQAGSTVGCRTILVENPDSIARRAGSITIEHSVRGLSAAAAILT